ncbi:MAG: LamG domain-containing protein [Pirellulales bacterium]
MVVKLGHLLLIIHLALLVHGEARSSEPGLIGYWKLEGDCQDYSGLGNHGQNHGVDLETSGFNGQDSYAEVPDHSTLRLGTGDFSFSAEVYTQRDLRDSIGDLLSKFDPGERQGLCVSASANTSGYNAQNDVRQWFFGLDNNTSGTWIDCGRPGDSTHISDALTVFQGSLYAGTTDGEHESDWAHVYRYKARQEWEDCGRLGTGRTRGVYAMIVHDGALYAATSASHGPQPPDMSFGRVYRYLGGKEWEDIGQPGENYRLNSLASFKGKLYVTGFNIGPAPGHCYVYEGGQKWKECGEFKGWPHALAVHDGKLYAAYPQGEVYAYDGNSWEDLGNPFGSFAECNQIHSIGIYRGELHVGTWPKGKVAVWRGNRWVDLGRPGDATEVIGLSVYNGSLYAGTIPRAEVFRFDGPDRWTSVRRIFDPPGFEPVPVGSGAREVQDWSRASSLAVFQGKLFVSTATCYRTMIERLPANDVRGKVFSYQTGSSVSFDHDAGPGWVHIAAIRRGRALELYIDGALVSESQSGSEPVDVSTGAPLRIGFGPNAHFCGRIRHVRLHNRALDAEQVNGLKRDIPGRARRNETPAGRS